MTAKCWGHRVEEIAELVTAGETYTQLRQALSGMVSEVAWNTDVKAARQHIPMSEEI
jgi:hypothetical protein